MRTIWDLVKPEFTKTGDRWGDPNKVCGFMLFLVSVVRRETGWPFIVHNAYETSGHSPKSQHYLGKAVDGHFATSVPFREQVEVILKVLEEYQLSNSVGLGVYPFWNNPGFHFDSRGTKARWSYDKAGRMVLFEEVFK